VSSLNAPGTIVLNEGMLVVNARVENPSNEAMTETVQLRIDGTVVAEQQVQTDPGESERVQFRVEKTDLGLEPGEAFLEVLTRNFGESISVTVTERPQEDTTTTEA
jgi:hypothetical protein